MGREIKFRAWDKDKKEMRYKINDRDLTPDNLIRFGHIIERDLVWTEFTGLFDKNGKEIYEGDIVKSRNYRDTKDLVGVVYFIHGRFRIEYGFMNPDKWDRKGIFMIVDIVDSINGDVSWEVIDNIYENPELLTKNKE